MINSPSLSDGVAPVARLRAARGVVWMFFSAPFLITIGAFITVAMQPFVAVVSAEGSAVLMAWFGAILLCVGVAFLIAGIVLVGVRSIMQHQTMLLLRGAQPERPGE